MISFFRRLAGLSKEQTRESERFRQNLERLEAKGRELELMHEQLKSIQERTVARTEEYTQITSSMTPPPMEDDDDAEPVSTER